MIRIELDPQEGVRISGTINGALLAWVLERLGNGEVVLDLSEVSEADAAAVRMLATPDGRHRLVKCPRWLALWIERERQSMAPVDAP